MFKSLERYQLKDYKFGLIVLLVATSGLGAVIVGSAQESLRNKQIGGIAIGLAALVVVSLFDYIWVLNFYWLTYAASIILLLLVFFFGDNALGATRWFEIGGFRFQPSEVVKILLILFFARYIEKYQKELNTPKMLISLVVLAAIPLVLIVGQPDLSTTIVTAAMICAIIFVGGLSYKNIGAILAVGIPVVVIFISIVIQSDQNLIENYQRDRIMAWLQPEEYALDDAYQQTNSIIAIGSGQLSGKGLNNNEVASVKNGNFISEPQTDFIFAVAGEELGFIGSCVIVGSLFLITIYCFVIGNRARDLSGRLICTGMGTLIGFQSFVNISVATGIFPNTGLTLPFYSYGLTSLISLFIGMGFVMNVALQPKKY